MKDKDPIKYLIIGLDIFSYILIGFVIYKIPNLEGYLKGSNKFELMIGVLIIILIVVYLLHLKIKHYTRK